MENRMEMQRLEMELRMDQQQKELVEYNQMSVNSAITKVPQIVQGILVGMGGYFNVAPLQIQGLASSQPALMIIDKTPTPQGSGTSTRDEQGSMKPSPSILPEGPPDRSPPTTSAAASSLPTGVECLPARHKSPDVAEDTSKPDADCSQ
jgi:hypothetical protein